MNNKEQQPKKPQNSSPNQAPYGGHYGESVYYGQAAYGESAEDGIDLMRLVHVALRHWKTIVLSVLIAFGIGVLYLLLATPVFQATALMEMSVRKPRLVKESAVLEDTGRTDTDMIFNTRLAKFQSRAMLERVAATYLAAHPDFDLELDALTRRLKDSTEWSVRRKSFIVEVAVSGTDPAAARDLANLYSECATQMMIEENRTSSDSAVVWLQNQANQQKADLAEIEQSIVDYRKEVSLDALRNRKHVSEETLVQLNSTLITLESKLITDRALLGYLNKFEEDPGAFETVPAGVTDNEQLADLIASWWDARLELSALQERYTAKHPQVKEAGAHLAQMRERLNSYLVNLSEKVGNGVALLQTQVNDIRARIDQETRSVLELELEVVKAEGHLNTLTRECEAADTSYRSVLGRIEESRMAADENTAVLKLLQAAQLPEYPVAPRKLIVLVMALFLGGMLGYGISWIIELVEDKLTGVADVEKMGLNMLALIPVQPVSVRRELATICLKDKLSHLTETFANLRTILSFGDSRENLKVILVTSSQPGAGKTIVASNLAIAMAQGGRKTLLIDFDLRRPRLRKIFADGKPVVSLLHTLEQGAFDQFEKLPFCGTHPNLDVITSKPSTTLSPAEIVGGKGPSALIAWAREHYECVIIDTPPLGVVGDSQSLANYADGVILVARPEVTKKRMLRYIYERLTSMDVSVIGVVLNNVKVHRYLSYSNQYHHYESYKDYGSYAAEVDPDDDPAE